MFSRPKAISSSPQVVGTVPEQAQSPQQRHQPRLNHHTGEHGADAAGGLAVGIGQPGVQRHEGHLDAKADGEQSACGQQHGQIGRGRRLRQRIKAQLAGGAKDQGNAQQHQHGAEAALHQVFDAGFERRRPFPIKRHQQVRRNRHALKPEPQVEQIVRAAQANHHAHHGHEHGVIFRFARLARHAFAGVKHHQRAQQQGQPGQQHAEAVKMEADQPDGKLARALAEVFPDGLYQGQPHQQQGKQGQPAGERKLSPALQVGQSPAQVNDRRGDQRNEN
jgi:hypothetical protein